MQVTELFDILIAGRQILLIKEIGKHVFTFLLHLLLSRFRIASILALALAVVAKLIHEGCTFCDLDVRIST